jgi:hypothetical protein
VVQINENIILTDVYAGEKVDAQRLVVSGAVLILGRCRSLPQPQPQHVAFLMHRPPVFVRFAGFKRHWLVAQRAANETGST